MCSCMPIIFVLFKGPATNGPWSYFMRYIRTRGRHSAFTNSNHPKDPLSGLSDEDPSLPQFQCGKPTRLHTFVHHKARCPPPPQGITVRTELRTYRSLASIDDTYHEQLKRTYDESYQAKNTVSSRTHATSNATFASRAYFAPPADVSSEAFPQDQPYPPAYTNRSSHKVFPAEHPTWGRAV